MRREVEFSSEGTTCRAWLYTPASGAPCPAVVMAHGFSGVKEMRLDRYADVFAQAGLASLVFDYRGWGASDGAPRQDLDPHAQLTDYRNAISFARSRPEIDRDRIGVWGTSFAGGHVLMLGAIDRRVKAVVAQVPLLDGWESTGRMMGEEGRTLFVNQMIEERERVYAGGEPLEIPVVDDGSGGFSALPMPDAREWFLNAAKSAPNWKNRVTLRSIGRMLEYAPARFIDRIAPTPLLLVGAEHDVLPADMLHAAFARAGEPKRLCMIPDGHFALYEEPHFSTAAGEAADWFAAHLRASGKRARR